MRLTRSHRPALLVAALSAALALSACAPNTVEQPGTTTAPETAAGPRTVVDHGGNEVILPAEITRVAVDEIPIASTYLAYFHGEAPHLVGMSQGVVSALENTVAAAIAPEILDVDTSYYSNGDLSTETLLTLEPDVVLYNANNAEHREMFEAAGIPAVGFKTSGDPAEVYTEWLRLLEDVFGEPGKMDEVIAYGAEITAAARARNAAIPADERKNVLIVFRYSPGTLMVAGGAPFFGSFWLETANADNAAAETTQGLAPVTAEQVLAWNPDTVLVGGAGQAQITPATIIANAAEGLDLGSLEAARTGEVFSTGLGMWSWFTPNPDAPLIATWIGEAIYPQLQDREALAALTREYYEKLYGYALSDAEIDALYADSFAQ